MATLSQARFDSARATVLLAAERRDAHTMALSIRYGSHGKPHSSWLTSPERKRCEQLDAAYDRAAARMWKLLEASPRDWRAGVPSAWVVEQLPYADAVAPLGTPLSVVPPCAWGYREPLV